MLITLLFYLLHVFTLSVYPLSLLGGGVVEFESTACKALGIRYISVNERRKEFLCVRVYVKEQGIETQREIDVRLENICKGCKKQVSKS